MGERKKKKRGQQREIIVPLPLESVLNRLNNRRPKLIFTVLMNLRKTDRYEIELRSGYYSASEANRSSLAIWDTVATFERLDTNKTRITHTPIRLTLFPGRDSSSFMLIPATVLMFIFVFWLALESVFSLLLCMVVSFIVLLTLFSIIVLHRRRLIVNLLHNLDKPLGE